MIDRRLRLVAGVGFALQLLACSSDDSTAGPGDDGGATDAGADRTTPGPDGSSEGGSHDATVDAPSTDAADAGPSTDGGSDALGDDGGADAADTGSTDGESDAATDGSGDDGGGAADASDASDASDGSTAHSVCVPGAAIDPGTDPCAATVCDLGQGADPYCCTTSWDLSCAETAHAMCASTCPGDPADGGIASLGGTPHAIAQLASRDDALCAVSVGGDVWCWGNENILGDGSEQPVTFPRRIATPVPTRAVAMATSSICALGTDDAVRCWGRFPVAASAPTSPVLTPPSTPLVTGAALLAGDRGIVPLSNDSMCVATLDAGVQCWGETSGSLGPGVSPPTTIPTSVNVGVGVSAVFSGGSSTCVLVGAGGGTTRCWGDNTTGMLGHEGFGGAAPVIAHLACLPASEQDGGPDDCANALVGVAKIAIGATSLCVIDATQAVRCLGSDAKGALGAGLDGGSFPSPQTVSGVAATDLAVGASHACAAPADASAPVVCWGTNAKGQLGAGFDGGSSSVPVAVSGLAGVKQLVAWSGGTCALKIDGTVWCWGADDQGQLARGGASGPPSPTPVQISFISFP